MAQVWEDLDKETQNELVRMQMKGVKPSPENENRARQQLSANPRLVERLMKEGMASDGSEESDPNEEEPDADPDDIEANAAAGMDSEAPSDGMDNDMSNQRVGDMTVDQLIQAMQSKMAGAGNSIDQSAVASRQAGAVERPVDVRSRTMPEVQIDQGAQIDRIRRGQ